MLRNRAIFAVTLLLSFPLLAAPFDDFKFATPRRVDVAADLRYYSVDANFDRSGNTYTRLPSGHAYRSFNVDLAARTRLMPRWHLYGSGQFASAAADNLSGGISQNRTSSGLSQLMVGTDYLLMAGGIMLIPDVSLTMPMTSVDRRSADAAIGEGAMQMNSRLVARIERRSWRFGGFVGVNYRDKGRSVLLPYGFLGELTFGRWNFGGDVRGYQSITNDKDLNSEATFDASYFCVANGCAKVFGAFNPAILQSNLWVRANLSPRFAGYLAGTFDVTGSSVARGFAVAGGIIVRFPTARSGEPQQRPDFEEDLDDGVDQSAFRGGKSMTPSVVPARPTLKDELNKTEMQIETKPVRPEA